MDNRQSRRDFLKATSASGISTALAMGITPVVLSQVTGFVSKPAINGGDPVRTKPWPKWPMWDVEADEKRVVESLRSGVWSRAKIVDEFEKKWAESNKVKRSLTTVNGTTALITALAQLDIGGGDEVILPPYTFIATLTAIVANGAMPVFADIDPETFQIDPKKIEEKITPRTKAILPVHICGLPADMVEIMKIAKKHNLVVVEDACQAWLAEINHQKVGTFGNAGCFSFQNSKNLPIGEGGAIISNDDELMDRCTSYHNYGLAYGTASARPGIKLRMTEYQAAIGLAQLTRLDRQTDVRIENAAYLRKRLMDIPGIIPYRLYENVTRPAFHLFPFHYKKEEFRGLSRENFLKALRAEGIPCSGGYNPLNTLGFLGNTFQTKNYRKMYAPEMLDNKRFLENNKCPKNDVVCTEAVWFSQNLLLGDKSDIHDIVAAVEKIKKNAADIQKKAS